MTGFFRRLCRVVTPRLPDVPPVGPRIEDPRYVRQFFLSSNTRSLWMVLAEVGKILKERGEWL